MKRFQWIFGLVLAILLCVSLSCGAEGVRQFFYDGAYHDYTSSIFMLKVNGDLLTPPVPPLIFSDYTLVPARAIFEEGLGAKVGWDGKDKVTISTDDDELILTLNDRTALLNGEKVTMPIPPKVVNNYTMIPTRFVGEHLNMEVDFDSETGTIILNSAIRRVKTSVTGVSYVNKSKTEGVLSIQTKSTTPQYKAFLLQDPVRLVIDVKDGEFVEMPSTIRVDKGNIQQIRFGQQVDSARVVVDMTKNVGYSIETYRNKLTVSIKIDSATQSVATPTPTPTPTAKPTPTPTPTTKPVTPEVEDEEEPIVKLPPITDYVSYTYKDAQDTIAFRASVGNAVKSGSQITVPVYDDLSVDTASKTVTGYFGKSISYKPSATKGGTITIALKSSDVKMSVKGKTIVLSSVHKDLPRSVTLDAGHGGADGGAVAYNEDGTIKAKEKDFNLDIALKAQKLLEAEGVSVHMIREEDVYVDYQRVGSIANQAGSTLFVSIHTNSATATTAHGIETFGYLEAGTVSNDMTGKRLSELLLEELLSQTGAYSRGVKDGKNLAVIKTTDMPATLIEIGFISNEEECEKMMDEEYRQKIAQAICDAVLRAFEEMDI